MAEYKAFKQLIQEDEDAIMLKKFRKNPPSKEVCDYLDENLPGWRDNDDDEYVDDNILRDSMNMIDRLYCNKNYREALNGLLLIKKAKYYGDNVEFEIIINDLINCCIKSLKKLKKSVYNMTIK